MHVPPHLAFSAAGEIAVVEPELDPVDPPLELATLEVAPLDADEPLLELELELEPQAATDAATHIATATVPPLRRRPFQNLVDPFCGS